jgi:hypothetical protein
MIFVDKLIKKERFFQRFVGLNFKKFEILEKSMEKSYKKHLHETSNKKNRKRSPGGGRKSKAIGIREKLIITLLYYKLYVTQQVLELIFDIDQSNISRIISLMSQIIEESADPMLKNYLEEAKKAAPSGKRYISNMDDFLRQFPEFEEIAIDATESSVNRPKEKADNKKYYSGKKKKHTMKTQITVSSSGKILDVSDSYSGNTHDKSILDTEKTTDKITRYSRCFMDKGYYGADNKHKDKNILIPFKKPKGGELTIFQKERNLYHGKKRVIVEHVFGKLKNNKIISDRFRGPKDKFNRVFRNIAALWNFQLQICAT